MICVFAHMTHQQWVSRLYTRVDVRCWWLWKLFIILWLLKILRAENCRYITGKSSNFNEISSKRSYFQKLVRLGWYNGLAPNRLQAITWNDGDQHTWSPMSLHGHNEWIGIVIAKQTRQNMVSIYYDITNIGSHLSGIIMYSEFMT